jgi:fibronectin-binding autotransporter adhesin
VTTFNLSGTGILSLPSAALMVGRSDAATTNLVSTYNQTGGSATVGTLTVGGAGGYVTGTFNVTAGTFNAGSFLTLVSNATSTANITLGGSAQVTLPAFPAPIGTANLTLDFTTGWLAPVSANSSYIHALTAAYLTTNGANFNVGTGTNITVPQVFQNASGQAGKLTKSGAGTLTLSGANTYTGNTAINAGTLLVAKPGSLATGTVTVGNTATLGGSGLIKGPVTVSSGGTLAPDAAAINTLTISNTLTLNAASQTTMKISKTAATNDVVTGVSTLTFGGTLTVNNQAGTFVGGESYQLFNATSYSGNFAATNLPALGSGLAWNWNPSTGNLSVVAPVTIPATGTNLSYAITGGGTTLTLNWPPSYLGWLAQSNSVDLGNTNDWHDITGSASVTNLIINLDPNQANVFYRMRHP